MSVSSISHWDSVAAFKVAIPNIEEDGTRITLSVTALVLGLATKLIAADLENLVYALKNFYNTCSHLVDQMKDDSTLDWQTHGQRLEDSWPERKLGPSEGMILRYEITYRALPRGKIKGQMGRAWNRRFDK